MRSLMTAGVLQANLYDGVRQKGVWRGDRGRRGLEVTKQQRGERAVYELQGMVRCSSGAG
jgi:hypothetical protein